MIRVLCSGMGLGNYVPGLLIREELRRLGHATGTEVFEEYFSPEQQQRIDRTASSYQRSFKLARVGQRMALGGLFEPIQLPAAFESILGRWQEDGVELLILLSGQWLPLASEYVGRNSGARIHLLHIDSVDSPSWSATAELPKGCEIVWLCSADKGRINARIPVNDLVVVPWPDRPRRVVCHGGGWGIGTYREHLEVLLERGFGVDVVVPSLEEGNSLPKGCSWFLLDPTWRAWQRIGCEHTFPPLLYWDGRSYHSYRSGLPFHGLLDRLRTARAVLSKPGGATLAESLITATPLVALDPYGEHEAANFRLWKKLGLGLAFDAWSEQGWQEAPIEACHHRLLEAAAKVTGYPGDFLFDSLA